MKYELLKDLPFVTSGNLFSKGTWVGGGWGVDRGETKYPGGGSSHNGVLTFSPHENKIISELIDTCNRRWIKEIPTRIGEAFTLYEEGHFSQEELISFIKGLK